MTLSERLKGLLARKNDDVQAAARRAGIGYATMHGYVNGTTTNPSTRTAEKIAHAYGVSVDWLLSGEEPAPVVHEPPASYGGEGLGISVEQVTRWVEGQGPPGEQTAAKLEILRSAAEMIRTTEPRLPDWWHAMESKVRHGEL